jgi:hypothetical protein
MIFDALCNYQIRIVIISITSNIYHFFVKKYSKSPLRDILKTIIHEC